jgi:hypothetical protein
MELQQFGQIESLRWLLAPPSACWHIAALVFMISQLQRAELVFSKVAKTNGLSTCMWHDWMVVNQRW